MIIKSVDPGCTIELQVENCVTGRVVRLTTTEDPTHDMVAFKDAVMAQFLEAWGKQFSRSGMNQ